MTPISARFAELRERGEKALVLYIAVGDPPMDQLPDILDALVEGGADLIEVGLPFSDPIADGPTIQAATQRALDRGIQPTDVFAAIKAHPVSVPLVVMGYYNSMLRPGLGRSAQNLKDAGVSGTIVSDLTPEESVDWCRASWESGLDNIFLAAPTSTDARLDEVCNRSSGFIYAVSRMGVTGAGSEVPPEAQDLVKRLRSRTELPICVGFGISRPEHVRMVCAVADGAVIGSWLVDKLAKEWNGGKGREALVREIRALKDATSR